MFHGWRSKNPDKIVAAVKVRVPCVRFYPLAPAAGCPCRRVSSERASAFPRRPMLAVMQPIDAEQVGFSAATFRDAAASLLQRARC
jgi:hypothetical protein